MPKTRASLVFLARQIRSETGRVLGTPCTSSGDRPSPQQQLRRPLQSQQRAKGCGAATRGRGDVRPAPHPPLPSPTPPGGPQARAAAARPAHRDSVLERDALKRVPGADPVLHMALDDAGAQRRPHAGRTAVRAGLGASQAQRQLGLLGLRGGARARRRGGRRGPVRTGAAFPQSRCRREIRHGSCQGRRGAELAKGAAPPPPPLPPHWGCGWPCRGGGRREAEAASCGTCMARAAL